MGTRPHVERPGSTQPYISETSAKSQPHLASVFLFCKMGLIIHILSISLCCKTDF